MELSKKATFSIFILWGFYLFILGLLQLSGLQFGFHVFAQGEDNNWVAYILESHGVQIIHRFWATNDRNPLSPWLWWLISPLVKWSEYSLYLVRKCMDPVLAIITFLLIDRLGKGQSRTLPSW